MPKRSYGPYPAPDIRYEPIKIRVLMTATGYPAHLDIVKDAYGKGSHAAAEDGWFWIFATVQAAADIRRRGLHAVGTVTTSFAPVQEAPVIYDTDPAWVPVVGTQAHTDLMLEETREREARRVS
jgi:hypothetical protein